MKILFIIAQSNFRDVEYTLPKEIFEKNNFKVTTASIQAGTAQGADGFTATVDIAVKDANIEDYNALVIAGGPGAPELANHSEIINIIKQAVEKEILVAAICVAPTILAKAGVLKGHLATVWNGDNQQSKILEQAGAKFTNEIVTIDGYFITGNGPQAAEEFAEAVMNQLNF